MAKLHIYAQALWHDEAYIAGSTEALRMLLDAINAAIETGIGRAEFFVCDGEGYRVEVVKTTDEQIDKMVVPYTDECAREPQDAMNGPWTLTGAA